MQKANQTAMDAIIKSKSFVKIKEGKTRIAASEQQVADIKNKLEEVKARPLPSLKVIEERLKVAHVDLELAPSDENQADVTTIEFELSDARQQHERQQTLVSGMEARLREAESEFNRHGYEFIPEQHQILFNLAEELNGRYVALCSELVDVFRELRAIANIADNAPTQAAKIASGSEHTFLSLPAFRLPSTPQYNNDQAWPMLRIAWDVHHNNSLLNHEDIELMKQKLESAGAI